MHCTILHLLIVWSSVSVPTTIFAKKQDSWNTLQNRNSVGDFNFGQEIGVNEGSGGTYNPSVGGTGQRNKVNNDDDESEDFDSFDFSGEEETGSGIETDQEPPVKSDKPCLKKLREATSLGAGGAGGRGFGSSEVFIPRCVYTGEYAPIQCHGDECWCADRNGNQIIGTVRRTPLTPDCSHIDRDSAVVRTSTVGVVYVTNKPPFYSHDQHPTGTVLPPFYPNEKHNIGNGNNNYDNNHYGYHDDPTSQKMARAFINQPGILAAIIAGAVIGLLSAVLLVMFIIYHLRHARDHADEKANKVPIIGYTNAHDRDLYA